MARSFSLVRFSIKLIARPMEAMSLGAGETRATGRPTSAPPDMGDFLMTPEVALTSDTFLLSHKNKDEIKYPEGRSIIIMKLS